MFLFRKRNTKKRTCKDCWADGEVVGCPQCWLGYKRMDDGRGGFKPCVHCPKPVTKKEFYRIYAIMFPEVDIIEAFKLANSKKKQEKNIYEDLI